MISKQRDKHDKIQQFEFEISCYAKLGISVSQHPYEYQNFLLPTPKS